MHADNSEHHYGIYFNNLYFIKGGSIRHIISNNISGYRREIMVTEGYIENVIGQGIVTIGIQVVDFAGNSSLFERQVRFDWTNTINEAIASIEPTEDHSNSIGEGHDNFSPFDVTGLPGIYDQPTVDFKILFNPAAYDTTGLNTGVFTNLPFEMRISYNQRIETLNSLLNTTRINDVNSETSNIGLAEFNVNADLEPYVGIDNYQGLIDVNFFVVDGAGNMSAFNAQTTRITVDFTPPTAPVQAGFMLTENVGYSHSDVLGQYRNIVFTHTSKDFVIRMMLFADAHSGLPEFPYSVGILGSDFNGDSLGDLKYSQWLSTNMITGEQINNFYQLSSGNYELTCFVRNQAGIMTSNIDRLVIDFSPPVIVSLNREVNRDVGNDGFAPEENFMYNKQSLMLSWNCWDNLDVNHLNVVTDNGIWYYTLSWTSTGVTGGYTTSGDLLTKADRWQADAFIVSIDVVSNSIKEGDTTFTFGAVDYAGNVTTTSLFVIFDWSNSAAGSSNSQLLPDNTDNSPSSDGVVPELGYTDQPTLSIVLKLNNVSELTDLSTKNMKIMISTQNGYSVLMTNNAYQYIIGLGASEKSYIVTINLDLTLYMMGGGGAFTLQASLLDRAGNLPEGETPFTFNVVVDMTPPTLLEGGIFNVTLMPDGDSAADGFAPEFGCYDSQWPSVNVSMNSNITSNGYAPLAQELYIRVYNGYDQLVASAQTIALLDSQNVSNLINVVMGNASLSTVMLRDSGVATMSVEDKYSYEFSLRDRAGHLLAQRISINYDDTPIQLKDVGFFQTVKAKPDLDSHVDGLDPYPGYFDSLTASIDLKFVLDSWGDGHYGTSYDAQYSDGESTPKHGSGLRTRPLFIRYDGFDVSSTPDVYLNARYPGNQQGADIQGVANDGVVNDIAIPLQEGSGKVVVVLVDRAGNVTQIDDSLKLTIDTQTPQLPLSFSLIDTRDISGAGILPELGFFNHRDISFNLTSVPDNDVGSSRLRLNRYLLAVTSANASSTSLKWDSVTSYDTHSTIPEELDKLYKGWGNKDAMFNGVVFPTGDILVWVGVADNAGNVRLVSQSIVVDIEPPSINTWSVDLFLDEDSQGDGVPPYYGYFDNSAVSLNVITLNYGESNKRIKDLFVAVDNSQITNPTGQVELVFSSINVLEGAHHLTVFVSDRAGNVVTRSIRVTVDTMAPNGAIEIVLAEAKDSQGDGIGPVKGYLDTANISFIISENLTDESGFILNRYFVRSNLLGTDHYKNFTYKDKNGVSLNILDEIKGAQPFGQSTRNIVNFIPTANDYSPIIVYGAVADKAGNVCSTSITLSIDTTPPSGNINFLLIPDIDSHGDGVDPLIGYYDNLTINVHVSANVNDNIGLRNNRYFIKTDPTGSLPSYISFNYFEYFQENADPAVLVKAGSITNNFYGVSFNHSGVYTMKVAVADLAGNITESALVVTIDTDPPEGQLQLFFDPNLINPGAGADYGWYNTSTINFHVNASSLMDSYGIRDNYFRSRVVTEGTTMVMWPYSSSSNAFRNVWVPEDSSLTNNAAIFVAVADNAGNIYASSQKVHIDLTPPSLFPKFGIKPDTKNRSDQMTPEEGWYNDDTIDLAWDSPTDNLMLKSQPFQVRMSGMAWGLSTNATFLDDFKVNATEQTLNIEIMVSDRAGNVSTASRQLLMDIAPPSTFNVTLSIQHLVDADGQLFEDPAWTNIPFVTVNVSEPVDTQSGLRIYPLQIKSELLPYGSFLSLNEKTKIELQSKYHNQSDREPSYLWVRVVDKAGNISEQLASVNIDTTPPNLYTLSVLPDTEGNDPASSPEDGWYNDTTLQVEWSSLSDIGELNVSTSRFIRPTRISQNWWVTIDQGLSNLSLTNLNVSDDSLANTLILKVVDRAGNSLKVESNGFQIDTVPPTVSKLTLMPDYTDIGGRLADGWYDSQLVNWQWQASDRAGLSSMPYRYHNLSEPHSSWSIWNRQTGTQIITTWGIPEYFELEVRDHAGNTANLIGTVNVSNLIVTNDSYWINGVIPEEGVTRSAIGGKAPELGCFNVPTLTLVITTNYLPILSAQQLTQDLLYYAYDARYAGDVFLSVNNTFSLSLNSSERDGLTLVYGIRLKNGTLIENKRQIVIDLNPPTMLAAQLGALIDHGGDGIAPDAGWSDINTLDIKIALPDDQGGLRNAPYRYRSLSPNISQWSEIFNSTDIFCVAFPDGQYVYEIEAADRAGNCSMTRVTVNVDTTPPSANGLQLIISADLDSRGDGIDPESGWYDSPIIFGQISWNILTETNTRDAYLYVQGNRNDQFNVFGSSEFSVELTPAGVHPINIYALIVDKAGNSLKTVTKVYVDTEPPVNSYISVKPMVPKNTYFKEESGYYSRVTLDLEWVEPIGGGLRTKPYEIQSSLFDNWSPSQSTPFINGFSVSEGVQSIIVRAIDRAGNVATFSTQITVDTTPPILGDLFLEQDETDLSDGFAPLPGFDDDGMITVTYNGAFDNIALKSVPYFFRVDQPSLTSRSVVLTSNQMIITPTFLVDAIHRVTLLAVDRAGNYSEASVSISVLRVAPVFSVFITPNEIKTDTILTVLITANQPLGWMPDLKLSMNSGLEPYSFGVASLGNYQYIATLDTLSFIDGIGQLRYKVVGKSGMLASIPIQGDKEILAYRYLPQPPDLIMINPLNGSALYTGTSNLILSSHYASLHPTWAWFLTDNATKPPSVDPAWVAWAGQYVLPAMSEGTHSVYAWVKNDQGMSLRASTVNIFVDTTLPSGKVQQLSDLNRFGMKMFSITTNEDLFVPPSLSIQFPAQATQSIRMSVSGGPRRFIAEFNFNEDMGEGFATLNLLMEDRAANISTLNLGVQTIYVKLQYPPKPVMKIVDPSGEGDNPLPLENTNKSTLKILLIISSDMYYIIDSSSADRPMAGDSRWKLCSPPVKDNLSVPFEASDVTYDMIGYDAVQGYLVKTFYVWHKSLTGYVSTASAMQRITIDITTPIITLDYVPLSTQNVGSINVSLIISASEWVSISDAQIRSYPFGSDVMSTKDMTFLTNSSRVFSANVNVNPTQDPYLDLRITDRAGNILDVKRELQPRLWVISMNVLTSNVYRGQRQVDIAEIVVSSSSVAWIKGIKLNKYGDPMGKSLKNVRLLISEDIVSEAGFDNTRMETQFEFRTPNRISGLTRIVLQVDIESSAMDPFSLYIPSGGVSVGTYDVMVSSVIPATTPTFDILGGANQLSVYVKDSSWSQQWGNVYQADQTVVLARVMMESYPYSTMVQEITFNVSGNLSITENLSNLRLYRESNYDDKLSPSEDTLLTSIPAYKIDGKIVFRPLRWIVGNSPQTLYLAGDISLTSPVGKKFQPYFDSRNDIKLDVNQNVNSNTLPLLLQPSIIRAYLPQITISAWAGSSSDVYQGDGVSPYEVFNFKVDRNEVSLNHLDFNISANVPYETVSALTLNTSAQPFINTVMDRQDNKIRLNFASPIMLTPIDQYFYLNMRLKDNCSTGDLQLILAPDRLSLNAKIMNTANVELSTLRIVDLRQPIIEDVAMKSFVNRSDAISLTFDVKLNNIKSPQSRIVRIEYAIDGDLGVTHIRPWTTITIDNSLYLPEEHQYFSGLSLKHNTNYILRLRAYSEDNSLASYVSSQKDLGFKVDLTPPVLPGGSKVFVNQPQIVQNQTLVAQALVNQFLSWPAARDDESGLSHYELQWQKANSEKWDDLDMTLTQNYYKSSNIDQSKRYRYRVRAVNMAGSETAWLMSDYTDVVKPNEVIYNASFYPNPFKADADEGQIYYELNQDTNVSIKIYDALGHFVKEMGFGAGQVGGDSTQPNIVKWNGTDQLNEKVSKGGYTIVIQAEKEGPQNKVRVKAGLLR